MLHIITTECAETAQYITVSVSLQRLGLTRFAWLYQLFHAEANSAVGCSPAGVCASAYE